MPILNVEPPRLWIVAGPNGSGKSTLYKYLDIEEDGHSVWIINPDILTSRIQANERMPLLKANREAVVRIEAWLNASIESYQTVGVETVLSTEKYRKLVLAAKNRGFEIRLLYVMLDSVEANIERVRMRVQKGGHSVPIRKIRERHARSLAQLPWFYEQADQAQIFDNSGADPVLMVDKRRGMTLTRGSVLPEIRAMLDSLEHRKSLRNRTGSSKV